MVLMIFNGITIVTSDDDDDLAELNYIQRNFSQNAPPGLQSDFKCANMQMCKTPNVYLQEHFIEHYSNLKYAHYKVQKDVEKTNISFSPFYYCFLII